MSLFSTISVRRSGEERSERNTYLAQQQSPVPTPFISPGDGIQYTKTPSCSSITPVPGIRAGLPGNWLVLDEHKVWDYPQRSGDYRKGWRGWEPVVGVWCRGGGSAMFLFNLAPSSTQLSLDRLLMWSTATQMWVVYLFLFLLVSAEIIKHINLIWISPVAHWCSLQPPITKRAKRSLWSICTSSCFASHVHIN